MIQEIVDEAIKPKEKHIASGLISPSGLGGCYRKQYWSRLGVEPSNPIDQRTQRVFACGNLFERFIINNLITRYPDWGTQVEVTWEDVHGYADLVTPDEVADCKSKHSKAFWYCDKEMKAGKDIKEMFYHNWLQVMLYAKILGKPMARLIYVSKDDLCIQEYALPLDDYWLEELRVEIDMLRTIWDKKILPPAKPRLFGGIETKKECGYCQFKDKCNTTEKGVQK